MQGKAKGSLTKVGTERIGATVGDRKVPAAKGLWSRVKGPFKDIKMIRRRSWAKRSHYARQKEG